MANMTKLYIGSDSIIKLEGLIDSSDNIVSDADVTVSIERPHSGDVVAGQDFPVTMSPVVGEAGNYQAVLEDTVNLSNNVTYVIEVVAVKNDLKATWREPVKAVYKNF